MPRPDARPSGGIAGALVFGVVLGASGVAQAYDPARRWATLHTPHFELHYPDGSYALAVELAGDAEAAFAELIPRLGWLPRTPIDVVVNDDVDAANGFAQSLPYNLIGLNAAPPEEVSELADYRDWTYELVAHELAHIVHIDTVIGLPRYVNALFGRLLAPNAVQPGWFIEGLAVYYESALGGAGRAHSPYFDMYLRAAVLDGNLMDLGEVSGAPLRWPQGTTRYLYGGRFLDYLARTYGEETLQEVSYAYGSRLIPYALNRTLGSVLPVDYATAYQEFNREVTARVELQVAEIEARGRREGRALTDRGQEVGPARVGADGTIYFIESSMSGHTALKSLATGAREREIAWVYGGASLALLPGGREALVAQIEVRDLYRAYGDLFRVDLETGASEQLTRGARAQSVDVAAAGDLVIFAQNDGAHSVVRAAPLSALTAVRTVVDLGPGTQVWSPRLSPDGRRVTFAGFADGRRDIYVTELDSGSTRALTADAATDGSPVFWPDGAWVLFHSDRDGVFNLYAVPTAGGEARRLSRVRTGAFRPEPIPGAAAVLYQSYGSQGFDLARLDGVDPRQAPPADGVLARPPARGHTQLQAYPSTPYRALPSLLPKAWTPILSTDTRGSTYGVSVNGSDAVGLHSYALQAWWGPTSDFAGFAVGYANRQFHPGLTLAVGRTLGFAPIPYVRNDVGLAVEEEQWSGRIGTTWPLVATRDWGLDLGTSWELTLRESTRPLVVDPFDLAPVFPDEGRFAAARVALSFSNAHGYRDSVSAEDGLRAALGLRIEDPLLGSEFSAVSGTLRVSAYRENPWVERHVLALDLTLGYGRSSYRQRRLFAIGGMPSHDLVLDLINGFVGANEALRGFPLRPFVGNAEAVAHAEYRWPIVDIETGLETLPCYLRGLSAAAFADGAALADEPGQVWGARHFSVGGELRLGLYLAYGMAVDVRLGYGRGLGPDRVQALYLVTGNTF